MDKRPDLDKTISVEDFRDFYWLKEELIHFCKAEGLSRQGSKVEIANRIEHYLKTGKKLASKSTQKTTSSFDWKNTPLSLATIITDNYKNTENVRTFFQTQIGASFKFNVKFMNWMKANTGKTLADAIEAWKTITATHKHNKQKEIAPQFEYNTYIRDFLADNPDLKKADAIQCWNVKRSLRGDNVYQKSDVAYREETN